ncbi:acetyltransferase [Niastella caeni]|uniref:Acetyltransferase n=1 Tax=Niastella caeni TaxID=2569763 RepID=A0A4S8HXD2_9BACT|nr:acetyltransferase [Niastella caeni]THU40398.1 acetyltransferase [Niastella caeni]
MTTSSPNSLCQSLNVRNVQPIVLHKELMPDCRISLRPVCIHSNNDINAIHEWLSDGSPGHLPVDQLRVFFILLAECTYAQAFMVLLNDDTPIGQFEVYQVLQDELKDSVNGGEGDYRIYIPVMPVIASFPDITIQIIQTCLHFFFSCSEVKRVFWVIPVNDKERIKVAIKAGFRIFKPAREVAIDGDQPANVYQCTLANFLNA